MFSPGANQGSEVRRAKKLWLLVLAFLGSPAGFGEESKKTLVPLEVPFPIPTKEQFEKTKEKWPQHIQELHSLFQNKYKIEEDRTNLLDFGHYEKALSQLESATQEAYIAAAKRTVAETLSSQETVVGENKSIEQQLLPSLEAVLYQRMNLTPDNVYQQLENCSALTEQARNLSQQIKLLHPEDSAGKKAEEYNKFVLEKIKKNLAKAPTKTTDNQWKRSTLRTGWEYFPTEAIIDPTNALTKIDTDDILKSSMYEEIPVVDPNDKNPEYSQGPPTPGWSREPQKDAGKNLLKRSGASNYDAYNKLYHEN